jgi:hypothetical protein
LLYLSKKWLYQPKSFGFDYDIIILAPGIKLQYDWCQSSSAPGEPRGAAVLDRKLMQNTLPTGDYLIRIDISRSENWDRKYIFVRVK